MHKKKSYNLKEKKKSGELIYGVNAVVEMLKAKRRKLISIYTTRPLPRAWERVKKYLPKYPFNIQYVSRSVLARMANSPDHMGLVAWVASFKYHGKMFDSQKKPFILLLDSIQDVHNLGAILRSAYCTGVDGVVLCKKHSALLTPAVFKSSAGLAEHLDIYVASSLKQAVLEIKKAGYKLYMAVLKGGENAVNVEYSKPMCLVIGNEAVGISKDIY